MIKLKFFHPLNINTIISMSKPEVDEFKLNGGIPRARYKLENVPRVCLLVAYRSVNGRETFPWIF